MKKMLLIVCIGLTQVSHSQQLFDTASVSNTIVKNMISYQVYEDISKGGQSIKSYGYASYFSRFDNPIPDPNIDYKVDLKKTSLKLDTLNYDIYEFNVADLSNYNSVKCSTDDGVILAKNSITKNPLSYRGLVAIHKSNPAVSTMLFISGRLFLDEIRSFIIKENDKSLRNYAMMRYFNYVPDIKQVNSKKGEIEFYSSLLKKNYKLIVRENDDQLLEK